MCIEIAGVLPTVGHLTDSTQTAYKCMSPASVSA